ncbi:D-glutamate cyclase family protein [Chelativorans salis]|uniref:D-glutamate cyclase family protein n=1 Tax=Chelativorans salis TaxID=2978478 RepID=UPI0021B478BD|nr:DUF1445 domain-containing protein [Chelativorans sp. EGI FJ00035]
MVPITDHRAFSFQATLGTCDAARLRQIIRQDAYEGRTSGLAPGRVQANLIILTRRFADDFLLYCKRNPKPLPLIGVARHGVPAIPQLGDIDLRTDVPRYDIYRFGALVGRPANITALWREDFAAFAIGSSFTFEHALAARGVRLRRMGGYKAVPVYRTAIPTSRAGLFCGELIVSMRTIRAKDIDKVRAITARFPQAHGAPIHVGDPAEIGIDDLNRPLSGDSLTMAPDEVPVFWASGLTAHHAVQRAKLEICITQSPGHMLLTSIDGRADIGSFKLF